MRLKFHPAFFSSLFFLVLFLSLILFLPQKAKAVTYMKTSTAVAKVLGAKSMGQMKQYVLKLSPKEKAYLKKAWKRSLKHNKEYPKSGYSIDSNYKIYYIKGRSGRPVRYAYAPEYVYDGKCYHKFVIGVNSKLQISDIQIVELECKEARGVLKSTFTNQFNGKGPKEPIELGKDITPVTDATDSSRFLADASRKAITLVRLMLFRMKKGS